jgi:hypothetical protein
MNRRLPKWLQITIAVGSVLALGVVDWLTGYELNFFVFYFLPVSISAWFLGFGVSISLAVLSGIVWFAADELTGHMYSSYIYDIWNAAIRLVSFLAIGWAVSRMREALDREHEAKKTLARMLSKTKVLEAFLPICAECSKIRDQQGVWQPFEVYIGQHSDTQFSHGYCPECARKAIEEAGLIRKGIKL